MPHNSDRNPPISSVGMFNGLVWLLRGICCVGLWMESVTGVEDKVLLLRLTNSCRNVLTGKRDYEILTQSSCMNVYILV